MFYSSTKCKPPSWNKHPVSPITFYSSPLLSSLLPSLYVHTISSQRRSQLLLEEEIH